jgi:two-component system NtrC family sensor kinase
VRRGTAITLFLPRSFEAMAQPREPAVAAGAPSPAGTVLLVEDNPDVVEVAGAYFGDLGYRTKVATSAQAGLDLLERESGVDLVFSDILMPGGMNGVELAREVRARFPQIVVLLTTGYSSRVHEAMGQGFEVLQKPYDLAGLKRALQSALKAADRPSAPAERERRRAAM